MFSRDNINQAMESISVKVEEEMRPALTAIDDIISTETIRSARKSIDSSITDAEKFIDSSITDAEKFIDSSINDAEKFIDSSITDAEKFIDSSIEYIDSSVDSLTQDSGVKFT